MTKSELIDHLISHHDGLRRMGPAPRHLLKHRTVAWLKQHHERRHAPGAIYQEKPMVPHTHRR